ncbi:MAG: inosine/xanthosine triphosphatase [Saprospiraceae bacterium]
MKIIVASKNPVKIQAVQNGFAEMFPDWELETEGVSVPSNVSDQPMGNEETFQGAMNRAKNAQAKMPNANFWVGVEGGNIRHNDTDMEVMAWIVVLSKDKMGKARTAGFFLPKSVIDLINQGYELGHADDIVFKLDNSKQKMGSAGLLTDGVMNRLRFYVPAVILALIPFYKKELF